MLEKSIGWMFWASTVAGWPENEERNYQKWPGWTGQGPSDG